MQVDRGDLAFNGIVFLILFILFLCIAYPLYFIVIASISDPLLVSTGGIILFPRKVTLDAYRKVVEYREIWIGYRNTLFYTAAFTALSVFMVMTAGYGLSRRNVPFQKYIIAYMTFTMFFSGGLIPTYLLMRNIHLEGNPIIIILMGCVSVYNIIIARTFLHSYVPEELFEAALIDGSDHLRYFLRIVLPLSPALIAVMVLFSAVAQWNQWFTALIYLRKQSQMPLQLVLRNIIVNSQEMLRQMEGVGVVQDGGDKGQALLLVNSMKYAVIIVSALPVMCLYPFLQKYFIKGVMIGSIKG